MSNITPELSTASLVIPPFTLPAEQEATLFEALTLQESLQPKEQSPNPMDPNRFSDCYLQHYNTIYQRLRAHKLRAPDAEDLAQQAFLQLYRHGGALGDEPDSPLRYVSVISRNLCVDYYKAGERKTSEPETMTEIINFRQVHLSPEQELYGDSADVIIKEWGKESKHLPPTYAEPLRHYLQGKNQKEMAAILGRSEPAIKQTKWRLRQELSRLARAGVITVPDFATTSASDNKFSSN